MSSFAGKVKILILTTALYASISLIAVAQETALEDALPTKLEVEKLTSDIVDGETSKQDDLRDNYFDSLQNHLQNRDNQYVENVEQVEEAYKENANEPMQESQKRIEDSEKEIVEGQNDETIAVRYNRKDLTLTDTNEDAQLSSKSVSGSRKNIADVLKDPELNVDDKETIKEILGVRLDNYQERADSRNEGKGDPRELKEQYKAERQNRDFR